jgi:RNA polymerase sigma-70 factor (ECF subfamily)
MAECEGIDDIVLVQRTLSGDSGAFAGLVAKYASSVLGFCRYRLGSAEEAEDASQDVFFRAYRSLGSFKLGRSFRAWLFAIAANRVKTRYASHEALRALNERLAADAAVSSPEGSGGDTEGEAMEALQRESLRDLIRSLGTTNRRVAELYYLGGLDVGEVAEALGLGTEAVKSRLFRSRKEIGKAMRGATEGGSEG